MNNKYTFLNFVTFVKSGNLILIYTNSKKSQRLNYIKTTNSMHSYFNRNFNITNHQKKSIVILL